MNRRALLAIALSAIVCSVTIAAEKHKPATHTVIMQAMVFSPATLTVAPGDTIVWVNRDPVAHTATARGDGGFDSGVIQPGRSWRYTVTNRGDRAYLCIYHPTMTGTLRVR